MNERRLSRTLQSGIVRPNVGRAMSTRRSGLTAHGCAGRSHGARGPLGRRWRRRDGDRPAARDGYDRHPAVRADSAGVLRRRTWLLPEARDRGEDPGTPRSWPRSRRPSRRAMPSSGLETSEASAREVARSAVKLVAAGATYQRQAPTAALVSAPGKRFASARDLVGKRVGIDRTGSIAHVALLKWLTRGGVRADDVELVLLRLPGHDRPAELEGRST